MNERPIMISVAMIAAVIASCCLYFCHEDWIISKIWPPTDSISVVWSSLTNGVSSGLSIGYYNPEKFPDLLKIKRPIVCTPLLSNIDCEIWSVRSNLIIVDLPKLEGRYRMELIDIQGKAVPKTTLGSRLGTVKPTPYKPKKDFSGVITDTGWRPDRYVIAKAEMRSVRPFLLQDFFNINRTGIYHLHFQMCGFLQTEKQENVLIWFPPVDAEIKVEEDK